MYAIRIRPVIDKHLLRLLDPSGGAMIGTLDHEEGSYLIVNAEEPSKNKVVSAKIYDEEYASRVSSIDPPLVKLNQA